MFPDYPFSYCVFSDSLKDFSEPREENNLQGSCQSAKAQGLVCSTRWGSKAPRPI